MKKMCLIIILFSTIININITHACATCLGRLEKDTPPFFTKEYDAYFWPDETTELDEQSQHIDVATTTTPDQLGKPS